LSINTYGLPEHEYTETFKKKAAFTFRLFQTFKGMAFSEGVNLENYSDKFIFDVFQDVIWTTDETVRTIQKEKDPELVKSSFDVVSPSREEILEELKTIKELFKQQ